MNRHRHIRVDKARITDTAAHRWLCQLVWRWRRIQHSVALGLPNGSACSDTYLCMVLQVRKKERIYLFVWYSQKWTTNHSYMFIVLWFNFIIIFPIRSFTSISHPLFSFKIRVEELFSKTSDFFYITNLLSNVLREAHENQNWTMINLII